jgi:hypothetical protein
MEALHTWIRKESRTQKLFALQIDALNTYFFLFNPASVTRSNAQYGPETEQAFHMMARLLPLQGWTKFYPDMTSQHECMKMKVKYSLTIQCSLEKILWSWKK